MGPLDFLKTEGLEKKQNFVSCLIFKRKVLATHSLTLFSTHSLLMVEIHVSTKTMGVDPT